MSEIAAQNTHSDNGAPTQLILHINKLLKYNIGENNHSDSPKTHS